jgi:hypothetical protein
MYLKLQWKLIGKSKLVLNHSLGTNDSLAYIKINIFFNKYTVNIPQQVY